MIFTALEIAINRYLELDAETYARWHKLDGKAIEIKILPLYFTFYLLPTKTKINVTDERPAEVDTTIEGTPFNLFKAKFTGKPENINIYGDAGLGHEVSQIIQNMDIDWEEHLSKVVGDVAASHVGKFVRHVKSFGENTAKSLQQNLTDYLQEESRLLPTRLEIEDFYNDVTILRNGVERLEATLNELTKPSH